MEIKTTTHRADRMVRFCLYAFLFVALLYQKAEAQPTIKVYTVKEGNMYIKLSKNISEGALDSFITQYGLRDLALKYFFKNNSSDSLEKLGWRIEFNSPKEFVISKPLKSFNKNYNAADKILLTEKQKSIAERFPSVSKKIQYGYNLFQNKYPFRVDESIVTFFLRNHKNARRVMLAGSFNTWEPNDLPMIRTDSGWISYVKLTPGKYWYKFIADGGWMVDDDNMIQEDDEFGNTNSVFFKTNILFTVKAFNDSKKVYLAGSFNNWRTHELQMNRMAAGWELPLYLADGTHTYRYMTDDGWHTDPANPEKIPNESNDFNSVIHVGKPYLFKLNGYTDAKKVLLTGSFNNWRKDELLMKKTETGWELPYALGPGNYEYNFIVDGKLIADPDNLLTANKENSYLVLDANYTFRLKGYSKAKTVFLAGDFNDWAPDGLSMKKEGNDWIYHLHLPPGKHLYKFVVDGEWIIDPANKQWERNEFGTGNSIIWIPGGKELQ